MMAMCIRQNITYQCYTLEYILSVHSQMHIRCILLCSLLIEYSYKINTFVFDGNIICYYLYKLVPVTGYAEAHVFHTDCPIR